MDLDGIQRAIENLPGSDRKVLAKWLRRRRKQADRDERASDRRVFYRSPALLWTLVSLAAFLGIEGATFRLGWYNKYLEPDSSAGMVESYQFWLRSTPQGSVPEVMVIGDSRIAEGFSSRLAEATAGGRIKFWNFGIGGSTPRVWYYELRDGDPTRRRFAAIVIPMDHYEDEDVTDLASGRATDLNFLIGRLRLADCADFASSMSTSEFQDRALRGCVLRGIPLRRDFQEFLLHRADRLKRARDWRENGLGYVNGYGGSDLNLRGLAADFAARTIVFPPGLDALRLKTIRDTLMPAPVPQRGETTRYRSRWLGGILDLYKNSPTRIIFLELPRAPLPKPESRQPAAFLRSALQRPRVMALSPYTFRDLETPEVFSDGLHLNRIGRGLFSMRIAGQIAPLIGIQ